MSVVYSSQELSGNKERAWEAVISKIYVSVDMRIGRNPNFAGEIIQSSFHDLDLTRARVDNELVRRTPSNIARDPSDSCVVMLVRRGTVTISQFGREADIEPDCFSILDLDSPYIHRHAAASDVYLIKIPKAAMWSRFREIQTHCAVSRPIGAGIGRIAADLIPSLSKYISETGEEAAACLAAQFIDILGLVFEVQPIDHPVGPSLARNAVRRRAVAYIDSRLCRPELDPAEIAAAVGVSVRYLHRSFEDIDSSVSTYIRSRRLFLCRAKLADPRYDLVRISDLARQHGFFNQSHFASSFKKEFGHSAREARDAATRSRKLGTAH
jgi:AraC-like DNA-binding protein